MRQYYIGTDIIRDALIAQPNLNVVTLGDLYSIDLNKQTIFPLGHIQVNQATYEGQVIRMNISVFVMDRVDVSKTDPRDEQDIMYGNDNTHVILNEQLATLNKMFARLERGDLYRDLYQLDGVPVCLPFFERFENLLVGWNGTFDLLLPNTDVTIC
jgi:hypothetical protein